MLADKQNDVVTMDIITALAKALREVTQIRSVETELGSHTGKIATTFHSRPVTITVEVEQP